MSESSSERKTYKPKHHKADGIERNGKLMLTEAESQQAAQILLKIFRNVSGATDCITNAPTQRIVIEFNYKSPDIDMNEWGQS